MSKPNITHATGASSTQHYDLDDALADTDNLGHLLNALVDQMGELDFGTGENRNHSLDRAMGIAFVAMEFNAGIARKLEGAVNA